MGLKDIFKKSSSTTVSGKVKSFLNKDSTKAALSFTGIVASVAIDVFCESSPEDENDDLIRLKSSYIDDNGVTRDKNDEIMW